MRSWLFKRFPDLILNHPQVFYKSFNGSDHRLPLWGFYLVNREKIVVIEDEPDIVEVISYNLKREGYNVLAVDRGDEYQSDSESIA